MNIEKFYGQDCLRTPGYASGASGVVYGNVRLQMSAYEAARRIHAAGPEGEAVGKLTRTDLQMMELAGIETRSNTAGTRVYIDSLPEPDGWLTPVLKEESPSRSNLTGPCGDPLAATAGPTYRSSESIAPRPWS